MNCWFQRRPEASLKASRYLQLEVLANSRKYSKLVLIHVVPRIDLQQAFWNQRPSPARMLITMSPPDFWRCLKELAEGLAAAGDDAEAAMSLRKELSEKYDIEVVGPPRQATG
jgi:hypothetical protein